MPLNKLENFIKNSEGRILYVNPNDLDATDGIENQGNSLTKPFKTLQRALIESARFSYLRGNDNDIVEKTTILLFPGEHLVDNRPGFGIRDENGVAKAVSPAGTESGALNTLTLTLNSNFDLTQEDNLLYKFNSTEGGVIVPRGTSIVGLDLRKTKIRPKYVPNPTDDNVKSTAIFRVTGACYFWQFTIFDGDENTLVYTDPTTFDTTNQSKPLFSHHKLTVFEYADGVNKLDKFGGLTDLDVYYSKLSNAYNRASGREVDQKFPTEEKSFAKQRPEYEIVGAFQSDRIQVTSIISGDGATPGQVVTVTTAVPHELTGGTPIKMEGVNVNEYNISTKVQTVLNEKQFTYLLPYVKPELPAGPAGGLSAGSAQVSVEVDTVTGASPYIFNCSLRSVFGMQGMKADGAKATGFKSMVVAQFTGVSLQKDDRAFVEYLPDSRKYNGISYTKQVGEKLASESSSPIPSQVYHLNKDAVYREGWKSAHITLANDAVLQIVSVFAIGYHIHFLMKSGGDASITNSNSNFGQFALAADGFKAEAFDKDDKGFITSVIAPKSIVSSDAKIDLAQFDKHRITAAANNGRLYLLGQTNINTPPSEIAQGFRIGARSGEKIYVGILAVPYEAEVVMGKDNTQGTLSATTFTSEKRYEAIHNDTTSGSGTLIHKLTCSVAHDLKTGESIRIIKDNGDLPEGLDPHQVYYAITGDKNSSRQDGIGLSQYEIQIASSKTNADRTTPVYIKTISSPADGFLNIISRVSDKDAGDLGHPMQFDAQTYTVYNPNTQQNETNQVGGWFIHVNPTGNTIYSNIADFTTDNEEIPYLERRTDDRSLDDKLYKFRYVIPKELRNARDPQDSFVIQESSSTNVRNDADHTRTEISNADYDYNRNTKFISYIDYNVSTKIVTIRSDKSHSLNVGDQIVVKNVVSDVNQNGALNRGYNGTFIVTSVTNDKVFSYSTTDILGIVHDVGNWTDTTDTRNNALPRFQRNNNSDNLFVYRTETINKYVEDSQDGVYHLYVLNGGNTLEEEFVNSKYNQNVVNLYPELDRDNIDDNPQEAKSYAKRFPLGDVVTNDLKKSITRETANKLLSNFNITNTIVSVTGNEGANPYLNLSKEHKINGLKGFGTLTGGSGHTAGDGEHYNIKVFNSAAAPASAVWYGATAKVTLSGGSVTSVEITEPGSGYKTGGIVAQNDRYYFDSSLPSQGGLGGAPSSYITITNDDISLGQVVTDKSGGDYVQLTGITTATDAYYRINDVSGNKQLRINKPTADRIVDGQQVVHVGPVVEVSSSSGTDTSTFITSTAHGLIKGNSFRVLKNDDSVIGDFIVEDVVNTTSFTTKTGISGGISQPKYILKHALSANNANSGKNGENLGVRGYSFFDHDVLKLTGDITTTDEIPVTLQYATNLSNAEIETIIKSKFRLGSYIQIDSEIMRIIDSDLKTGIKLKVIRGSMGTIVDNHVNNSQVKAIKPIPIELRRPSILRASGHTFEYLGYGPGNYSTGLPQVQLKTPTQREEFLSQSQETSCGTVVYTGMNDKGDFYIGNTKISSDSGEQITFDIPVPTVTGEDPSALSVVFDEVIIKDRLLVEGGSSKQILSQFDGPVTFNGKLRINKDLRLTEGLTVDGAVRFTNETNTTSDCTGALNGAFILEGGAAIRKGLNICGDAKIFSETPSTSVNTGSLIAKGGVGISGNTYIGGTLNLTGLFTANGGIKLPDDVKAIFGTDNDLEIYHSGTKTVINGANSEFDISGGNNPMDQLNIKIGGQSVIRALKVNTGGSTAQLAYSDGSTSTNKLETRDTGVKIFGDLEVSGDITAYASVSDVNLKDNVTVIPDALSKVKAISGNTFTWKEYRDQTPVGTEDTGVIAQEIEALGLPGITTTRDSGHKAVRYEKIIPILIEAIKELSAKVDALS